MAGKETSVLCAFLFSLFRGKNKGGRDHFNLWAAALSPDLIVNTLALQASLQGPQRLIRFLEKGGEMLGEGFWPRGGAIAQGGQLPEVPGWRVRSCWNHTAEAERVTRERCLCGWF